MLPPVSSDMLFAIGSIGAVAYMLYLPEYGVSIAAMMNSFEGKSLSVKGLARVTVNYLRDR